MRLRTIAGSHAGEIRDYPFLAARTAIASGMAEPVDVLAPVAPGASRDDGRDAVKPAAETRRGRKAK